MTQHNTNEAGHNTHPRNHNATGQALDTNKLRQSESRRSNFVLSRDPDKAMQEMMDTISSLRNVYEQENEALKAANTKDFMRLFDKKIHIARQYEAGVQQMIERKDEFKAVNQDLKKKLYEEQEEFSALAGENLKALDRVRKSVKRLGERIMAVARDTAGQDSVNYGASGNLTGRERAVSIGLNESA